MSAEAMSKKLFDQLVAANAEVVTLHFSGGSDEGYLDIEIDYAKGFSPSDKVSKKLEKAVDDWAWTAYRYNGAGDGSSYGDDYTYDLKKGTVAHSAWYTQEIHQEEAQGQGEIEFTE